MESNKSLKFEARLKDPNACTYGVWNNDMYSWQYILDLDAYETQTFDEAVKYTNLLNVRFETPTTSIDGKHNIIA